jgi:hypothetical protein
MTAPDPSAGLVELAGLINWHVGVWADLGYENPPTPGCHRIPPLGDRPAEAIKGGHDAVEDIDRMMRQLHGLRARLVSEMRQDEDLRLARLDAKYGPTREAGES